MLNAAGTVDGTGSAPTTHSLNVEVDSSGYPKLPLSFTPRSFAKPELEDVMKFYLAKHYSRFLY